VTLPLAVLGTHTFAEEVADLVEQTGEQEVVAFVENWDRDRAGRELAGRPVIWVDELAAHAGEWEAVCAIGSPERRAYVEHVAGLGVQFATVIHPTAVVAPSTSIGAGCIVSPGVVVGAHTRIGRHVILNRGVLVGHHTQVGECVTLSPAANVAGCVEIGDGAYIGMGATVIDRRTVGAGALVAAGAVVVRDVPDAVRVQGVPARAVES
jgi:sugar O-acyltransferase (sialic acid O-acetyltransferase NeuD family)